MDLESRSGKTLGGHPIFTSLGRASGIFEVQCGAKGRWLLWFHLVPGSGCSTYRDSMFGISLCCLPLPVLVQRGPVVQSHTGKECFPRLEGVWRALAPLMSPSRAEAQVPCAANLNFYGGSRSHVVIHCDDEPLFGGNGDQKFIVSLSLRATAAFRGGRSPARVVMWVRVGSTTVTSWSWMDCVRTNSFTARVPIWRTNW